MLYNPVQPFPRHQSQQQQQLPVLLFIRWRMEKCMDQQIEFFA